MEEDDDFGEIYSDVLLPFPSPPSSSDHPIKTEQSIKTDPNPNPNPTSEPPIRWNLNLIPKQEPDLIQSVSQSVTIDNNNNNKIKEEPVTEKEEFTTFDIEENDDLGTDPMRGREDEDWDSDSDDDLQIVLDDDKNMGMMNEGGGGDEEGENMMMMREIGGELGPMMEERDWGEDGTTQGGGGEGERKEGGDGTAKLGGGLKIGFNNSHSYHHPYHSSQFKVR